MITQQPATPSPTPLTDQPTHWPKLYFLPQTRDVKRQRAANSPEYNPSYQLSAPDHHPLESLAFGH
jgi:hypothetical protein